MPTTFAAALAGRIGEVAGLYLELSLISSAREEMSSFRKIFRRW
jgi:hypothetical protein